MFVQLLHAYTFTGTAPVSPPSIPASPLSNVLLSVSRLPRFVGDSMLTAGMALSTNPVAEGDCAAAGLTPLLLIARTSYLHVMPWPQAWTKKVDVPAPVGVHAPNDVPPLVDTRYWYVVIGQSDNGTVAGLHDSSTPPRLARLVVAVSPLGAVGSGLSLSRIVTEASACPGCAPTRLDNARPKFSFPSMARSLMTETVTFLLY